MTVDLSRSNAGLREGAVVLGVDTCGPSGSVALGRLTGGGVGLLGQIELAGRSYSATLVAALGEILSQAGIKLGLLDAIVAVHGPGSFTGVRVGLSAVKGLAEPGGIPVAAVSRLEVLASKAGVLSAALDAHRQEVFLRVSREGVKAREVLAGRADFAAIEPKPLEIAVCDEDSARMIGAVWPEVALRQVEPPTASDALLRARRKLVAGEFVDLALLDGNYLRRSDAEIFGEAAAAGSARK
jgi:tRNA threonylcarbamoyladenosine biosynthesis protein TsaB